MLSTFKTGVQKDFFWWFLFLDYAAHQKEYNKNCLKFLLQGITIPLLQLTFLKVTECWL